MVSIYFPSTGIIVAFLFSMKFRTLNKKFGLYIFLTGVSLFGAFNPVFANASENICVAFYRDNLSDYKVSDLVNPGYLESGGVSHLYKASLRDGQLVVYALRKNLLIDANNKRYLPLTKEEESAFKKIDFDVAKKIVKSRMKFNFAEIGLPQLDFSSQRDSFLYTIAFHHAEMLLNYLHIQPLSHLLFNGNPIAPRIFGFITDGHGIRNGTLSEYIPGKDLWTGAHKGDLSKDETRTIIKSAREQLEFLHKNGFVHGDPSVANIVYNREVDGTLSVRLIDFSSPNLLYGESEIQRDTPEKDLEVFENSIKQHLPYVD